jgi:hypothetical protein
MNKLTFIRALITTSSRTAQWNRENKNKLNYQDGSTKSNYFFNGASLWISKAFKILYQY